MRPEVAARGLSRRDVGLGIIIVALLVLPLSDLAVTTRDPWTHVWRFVAGFLAPDFSAIPAIGWSIAYTVAFALVGVAIGAACGVVLAPLHHIRAVRVSAACLRAIHELFWAILFLQIFGPSPLAGALAIALPYAGVFTKVYAEMLEEADRRPDEVLPPGTGAVSRFLYARLPMAAAPFRIYTLYRLECGLRSSAVLGFVGLPTLGFQLDAFFKGSQYEAVAAILLVYYILIASIRLWARPRLLPVYLAVALAVLLSIEGPPFQIANLLRFLGHDIIPAPLRGGDLGSAATWGAFGQWLNMLLMGQAAPGLWATIVVTQLALAVTAIVALAGFGFIVPRLVGRVATLGGHLGLVIGRSTPEYMLVYILLQMFGPSMLPAVVALGVHNGAIIGHLLGRQAEALTPTLRPDAPRGFNLYFYEYLPRLYGNFLAYVFYRWEIILRESAIVGVLGVKTLGYYVDSAITEIRLDRAVVLLVVFVLATFGVDAVSRWIRRRFRLSMNDVGMRERAGF
jgi:phosphonate transport system permease protein